MSDHEVITNPANARYRLFPIIFEDIWRSYKLHEENFWTAEEIDFSGDLRDWNTLSSAERQFIELVLAFFSISDGIVSKNLEGNFVNEVTINEAKYFYNFQNMMENIHAETYAQMIETLIVDQEHRNRLFDSIPHFNSIQKKAKWMERWMNPDTGPYAQRLIAFAIVEGVFFSASFASIYWLRDQHPTKMKGLGLSNELIARDEGMHTDFAVLLYTRYIKDKVPCDIVHDMFREAVELECLFVDESLPDRLTGMNAGMMKDYVKFTADRLLKELGYPVLFKVSNPFIFMDKISTEGKTNFFERRVSEYGRAGFSTGNATTNVFDTIDDDF